MRSKKIAFSRFQGDCEFNYCDLPAWTRPQVRDTLIAFLIIAYQGKIRIRIYCILAFKCGPTVSLMKYAYNL